MLLLTGGKDIEREAYGETKPFAESGGPRPRPRRRASEPREERARRP